MKVVKIMLVSLLFCVPAMAQVKPCEELRSEIDAKLKEKGVQNYMLEIVKNEEVGDRTVVGSCNGGQNKIVYTRGVQRTPEASAVSQVQPDGQFRLVLRDQESDNRYGNETAPVVSQLQTGTKFRLVLSN